MLINSNENQMILKDRIVDEATGLFFRSGIRAITMDDISREAGVSKRTVYENFKDKDELLRSCLIKLDKLHEKETHHLISDAENTIDLVFRMLEHGISAINSINPLFITDLKRYHYRIWKETYTINYERHLSHIFTIIKKGINEGLFRREINIDIVAILLNQQLNIMSDDQIFPEGKFSKTAVFEHIIINFLRGIATEKGLKMIEKHIPEKGNK